MDATTPTRRSALGILATGPIAVLPALAVMQCSAPADAAIDGALAKAIERYRAAEAAVHKFDLEVHQPAFTKWRAAMERRSDRQTTRTLFTNDGWKPLRVDDDGMVKFARYIITTHRAIDPDHWDAMEELAALADARDADLPKLRAQYRIDELIRASEALGDAADEAEKAVIATRVTSLAELGLKVEFIIAQQAWDHADTAEAIQADIERLAAAGRA